MSAMSYERRRRPGSAGAGGGAVQRRALAPGKSSRSAQRYGSLPPPTSRLDEGARRGAMPDATEIAAGGIAGPAAPLPHADAIQRSFGSHDVTGVRAHVGGAAADAAAGLGAEAFATGNDVAFAGPPDLHTAAHVVQQRGGVQFAGGLGPADHPFEAHADAVADRVVAGESAEDLLDRSPALGAVARKATTDGASERTAAAEPAEPTPVIIIGGRLRIRSAPETRQDNVVGSYAPGTRVEPVGNTASGSS